MAKSKLTPETHKRIMDAIRLGSTYEMAANYGGITYATFWNWCKRGEAESERRELPRVKAGTKQWNDEQPYFDFFDALKKAEGESVVMWLAKIEKAATDGSWQAAAWKLERRYPEDYGRQVHKVEHGGEINIKGYTTVSPEDWDDSDE